MSNPLTPAAWARKFYFTHGRRPTNGEYRAAYEAGEVSAKIQVKSEAILNRCCHN